MQAHNVADSALVRYRTGYRYVELDYCDNRSALEHISRSIKNAISDHSFEKLVIKSYASPDGTDKANLILSQRRVDSLSSFLVRNLNIPKDLVEVHSCGIAWERLRSMVQASDMKYREDVLSVLDSTDISLYETGNRVVSERKRRLLHLHGGQPYAYMKQHFFPELRHSVVITLYLKPKPLLEPLDTIRTPEHPKLSVQSAADIRLSRHLLPKSAQATPKKQSVTPDYYHWAVKTNVAYLAATVANLGVEYSFGKHFSVDLPVNYSPYTVARKYRLRFLTAQPEFRYWLRTPTKGHFFGAHVNIGVFNVSLNNESRYQSPHGFYGLGISYGYSLPFAKHWAAEFTLGAGYVHTKYDAYYNISNGARYEKGVPYNYWGLTKVGVSIVYRFGK